MADLPPRRRGLEVAEPRSGGALALDGALLLFAIASTFFATVLPTVSPAMLLCGPTDWPLSSSGGKLAAQAVLLASFVLLVLRASARSTAIPGDQRTLLGTGVACTLVGFAWTYLLFLGDAEQTTCLGSPQQAAALMTALSVLPGTAMTVDATRELLARATGRRRVPGVASAVALAVLVVSTLLYLAERG